MTRYILGDLRTGGRIVDLPVLTGPWEDRLDTAETITVSIDLNDPDALLLDLRNASVPCKTFLGVVEGDMIVAAGPIWTRNWKHDTRELTLGAKGMASYFDHRLILPLLAASVSTSQWTVPDPADHTKTIPNPALSTNFRNVWLGTVAKGLVAQAQAWTGGNVPVVLPDDKPSSDPTHDRTYLGTDFKPIGEALQDLTDVIGGPEINFQPQFTPDGLSVQWVMQVGTAEQPLLFSPTTQVWDASVDQSVVSELEIAEDGSRMGSRAWLTGGNQSDDVLVSRSYDPTLVNAGFPLMELIDTSHQSVSRQSTLDGWASAATLAGRGTTETWSFTVEAWPTDEDGDPAGPQADTYNTGDFAKLIVQKYDPVTGRGDPYLRDGGEFPQRIIGRSGDETGQRLKIFCQPVIGV